MDKLAQYRSIIQTILTRYYKMTVTQMPRSDSSEVSDRLAFDTDRDQYLWFRFGWTEFASA